MHMLSSSVRARFSGTTPAWRSILLAVAVLVLGGHAVHAPILLAPDAGTLGTPTGNAHHRLTSHAQHPTGDQQVCRLPQHCADATKFKAAHTSDADSLCDAIIVADPKRGPALPLALAASPIPTSGVPRMLAKSRTWGGPPMPAVVCRRAMLQVWRI